MEVSKFDSQWERDNCECVTCRCERYHCCHEEKRDMDKELDLKKAESMESGDGGVMWSEQEKREREQWEREQEEMREWVLSEAEKWDENQHGDVNEYTGMMDSVRKVRCDQDDVNGVALRDTNMSLDTELEMWLETLEVDEKPDLPNDGMCIDEEKSTKEESVDAPMVAAATFDGSVGTFVEESKDALMDEAAAIGCIDGTCEDISMGASFAGLAPIDADKDSTDTLILGFVTPPKSTLTKLEVLQIYGSDDCRCSRVGDAICQRCEFCASFSRGLAREERKKKWQADEEVRKTLFK